MDAELVWGGVPTRSRAASPGATPITTAMGRPVRWVFDRSGYLGMVMPRRIAVLWVTRRKGLLHRATRAFEELGKLDLAFNSNLEILTLDNEDAQVLLPPGRWQVAGGEVLEGGFAWSGDTLPPGGVIAYDVSGEPLLE